MLYQNLDIKDEYTQLLYLAVNEDSEFTFKTKTEVHSLTE